MSDNDRDGGERLQPVSLLLICGVKGGVGVWSVYSVLALS